MELDPLKVNLAALRNCTALDFTPLSLTLVICRRGENGAALESKVGIRLGFLERAVGSWARRKIGSRDSEEKRRRCWKKEQIRAQEGGVRAG